jgi:hypothetical protein
MDDRELNLLQEIRDLLQRSVANQEQVLRANDEAMRLYREAGRRQLWGIIAAVGLAVAMYLLFFSVTNR